MKLARNYIEFIAGNLRVDVTNFQDKGDLLLGSQYNQETAKRFLEEARRLESILVQIENLLNSDREFFDLT